MNTRRTIDLNFDERNTRTSILYYDDDDDGESVSSLNKHIVEHTN